MNTADDLVDVMDVLLVVSRAGMTVSWVWMTDDELVEHSVGTKDTVWADSMAAKKVDTKSAALWADCSAVGKEISKVVAKVARLVGWMDALMDGKMVVSWVAALVVWTDEIEVATWV